MPSNSSPSEIRVGRTGPRFAMVFADALLSPEFMTAPDSAKRVYLALCLHAGGADRSWWLSAEQLAKETHQTTRSVWRGLRELVSRGLVQRVRRSRTVKGEQLQGAEAEGTGWKLENLYLVNDGGPQVVQLCEHCGSPYHGSEACKHQSQPQVPEPPNNPQARCDSAVTTGSDRTVATGSDSAVTTSEQTREQTPETETPPSPPQAGGKGARHRGKFDEDQVRYLTEKLTAWHAEAPEEAYWDQAAAGHPDMVRYCHLVLVEASKPQQKFHYDARYTAPAEYSGSARKRTVRASLIEAWRRRAEQVW